jgi:hypothetical protein
MSFTPEPTPTAAEKQLVHAASAAARGIDPSFPFFLFLT